MGLALKPYTDVQLTRYKMEPNSESGRTHEMTDEEDLVDLVKVADSFGPHTALGTKAKGQKGPPGRGSQDPVRGYAWKAPRSKSERVRRYRTRAVHSTGPANWAEPRSKARAKSRT